MKKYHGLKPFLSILLLVSTLFSLVFLKMEVRRMGYSVLKASQEFHKLEDHHRMMSMEYARLTRPEHVRKYAMSHLTLNDARNGQIIQLTGQKIALPQ
jgi:cell division protein FtsL